jgi:hypothetical protein
LRNNISISLALYAAIALLLFASPVLSNFLLQPVQAQTTMTFKTPQPANGNIVPSGQATVTFDGQGTASTASGTIQLYIPDPNGVGPPVTLNSSITGGTITDSRYPGIDFSFTMQGQGYSLQTQCGTSSTTQPNSITINEDGGGDVGDFAGTVECSSQGGGDTTSYATQPSSSPMTGSSQGTDRGSNSTDSNSNSKDGDSDGIPDSSDKCTHNSNPKCFKEGDTSSTTTTNTTSTTHEQEQPSSNNRSGNQTG